MHQTSHADQPDRDNKKAGIMGQGIVLFHRSWGLAIALVCVSPLAYAEVQDYVQAGIIKVVRGDVQVLRQGAAQKPAQASGAQAASPPSTSPPVIVHVGDRLFSGDRVVTGDGAAVGITLRDDTLVSLGPKSTFVLEQYNFNESSGEGNVAVRVVKGTLRYVTGLIGKHAPERQQVMTPTATIGIRGTDFIVDVASE
ncbi:FecR domain-containing protein [Herbaspirillum sp. meg3]|uniref:FecR family protein n=1 Tax=Herbaspirillum sp. meg3 TaxID=2025949 RepID=UPI001E49C3F5|nr:FecR domain-containing protein [Herbaspirillum sp. meg3]